MKNSKRQIQRNTGSFAILIIIFFIILIISCIIFFTNEIRSQRTTLKNEIEAISKLKTERISAWYNDQMEDTKLLAKGEIRKRYLFKWLKSHEKEDSLLLTYNLFANQQLHSLLKIMISDTNGKILLSSIHEDTNTSEFFQKMVRECARTKKPLCSDLYLCQVHHKIHIDFMAPITDENEQVKAVIICRQSPDTELYSIITEWPVTSKTSEALMVRKEGDSVLFLNNLKFTPDAAMKLKFPLKDSELPAAQVVKGRVGIFDGKDYRGVKVIAYLDKIPFTNWFLVVKVDKKELYKSLYYESILVILLFLVLFTFIVLSGRYISRTRELSITRELYNTQAEFKTTLYSIGDAVIVTDNEESIELMNPEAEKLTGYSEQEAKGRKLSEIFKIINEETRQPIESPVQRVIQEGLVVGLANHTLLISKSANEIPIADSGAPVKNEKGEIIGVILVFRDQTQERNYLKKIEKSEKEFRQLFESANDGICIHEVVYNENQEPVNYRILKVNKSYEKYLNLRAEDVVGKLATEAYQVSEPPYFNEYLKVVQTGEPIRFETYFETMNKYFIISVFSHEEGKFVTVFQDISARKLAEIELKSKLEELQRWYNVTLTREERIVELKKEVNELLRKLGQKVKYGEF